MGKRMIASIAKLATSARRVDHLLGDIRQMIEATRIRNHGKFSVFQQSTIFLLFPCFPFRVFRVFRG